MDVDYRLPLEFKAGLAWVGPRAQVEFDVLTHAAGGRYSAYSTDQTWMLATDPGTGIEPSTQQAPLTTPTVTVFGSTDPREWHMGSGRDVALWKGLSCSPCRRLDCPMGVPCMDVGVREVLDALSRVLVSAS